MYGFHILKLCLTKYFFFKNQYFDNAYFEYRFTFYSLITVIVNVPSSYYFYGLFSVRIAHGILYIR